MNQLSRSVLLLISLGCCAAGLITIAHDSSQSVVAPRLLAGNSQIAYDFGSGDLRPANFAGLEEIVRADAANRFPNSRIELGSLKTNHSGLTMNVVLFGPNHQSQAFVYNLVPKNNSWQIVHTHRLWFVPASQIARGLQV